MAGAYRPDAVNRAKLTLAAAASLLALVACSSEAPEPVVELGGPTMGTTWSVKVVPGPSGLNPAEREAIDAEIREFLARINALMSTWDPNSELSRFNRLARLDRFAVAPETFEVFRWAVELAEETGGAFDVTVAPLVNAWGFGAGGVPEEPPDEDALERLRAVTGAHLLELDPGGTWVRKLHPAVQCDFSGIAPGYAADEIAVLLEQRGLSDFLVDVGGELVARGVNDGGVPWQIAIERPQVEGRAIERIVSLSDASIATSGDYRNYREVDGERVAHIVDPTTGRPIRHSLASVSVVDSLGVRADAYATALLVLGPERGMALANELDLAALFVNRAADGSFEERATPRFEALSRD